MKYIISGISIAFIFILASCGFPTSESYEKNLDVYSFFRINDSTNLVCQLRVTQESIDLKNGDEIIKLKMLPERDSVLIARFPVFNSYLFIENYYSGEHLTGYYIDSSRKDPYKISFSSGSISWLKEGKKSIKTYETYFSPGSENEFVGKGIFNIQGEIVKATFQTETGDFRFLSGPLENNQFTIGAIDGSHVFTFKGEIKGDCIKGNFYSGSHWSTNFVGVENPDFELADPDTLTKVISKDVFDFLLPNQQGDSISFIENYSGKVSIVQILGSWCPNCMDETRYYIELQNLFPDLEIIGVAFERSEQLEIASKALERMKSDLGVNYDLLIGGVSRKSVASEVFPMLNRVISFPTSIYIDKKGVIRKVHTGFNGPPTGQVYLDYKKETEEFVAKLLAE